MTPKEPQHLSRAGLLEMILDQQAQIEKLRRIVNRLETRVAELEARSDSLDRVGGPSTAIVDTQQATRDALRHLDDVTYLAQCRLAKLLAHLYGQSPGGHTLRNALTRAIRRTKPTTAQSPQTRKLRCYDILRMTYLESKRPREVARALAISERQYYRELKAAIRRVVGQILGPEAKSWQ